MIPHEAVEAAAKVLCEQLWDNAHESQRAYARDEAREALEAAAPILMAQAWQEGFKQGGPMHDEHYGEPDKHTINPYREV